MNNPLSLKDLERKAYNATYQDGLWDIYIGMLLAVNAWFFALPDPGESSLGRLAFLTAAVFSCWLLYKLGKRLITDPRLGQVSFGKNRQRKQRTLIWIKAGFVVLTLLLVLLTAGVLFNPGMRSAAQNLLPEARITSLTLGLLVGTLLGLVFVAVAYFNDFARGYYIAGVAALAFFLGIGLENMLYLLGGSLLIALPGLALLVHFIRTHPIPGKEGA